MDDRQLSTLPEPFERNMWCPLSPATKRKPESETDRVHQWLHATQVAKLGSRLSAFRLAAVLSPGPDMTGLGSDYTRLCMFASDKYFVVSLRDEASCSSCYGGRLTEGPIRDP